jgi:hypothetical protein
VSAIDVEVIWTDSLGKKSGKEYPPRPPARAAEMAPEQVRIVQTAAKGDNGHNGILTVFSHQENSPAQNGQLK